MAVPSDPGCLSGGVLPSWLQWPAAPVLWAQAQPPLEPLQGLSILWAILAGLAILFLLVGVISLVFHQARRLRRMRLEHGKTVMPDIWFLNPPPPRKKPPEGDVE